MSAIRDAGQNLPAQSLLQTRPEARAGSASNQRPRGSHAETRCRALVLAGRDASRCEPDRVRPREWLARSRRAVRGSQPRVDDRHGTRSPRALAWGVPTSLLSRRALERRWLDARKLQGKLK